MGLQGPRDTVETSSMSSLERSNVIVTVEADAATPEAMRDG